MRQPRAQIVRRRERPTTNNRSRIVPTNISTTRHPTWQFNLAHLRHRIHHKHSIVPWRCSVEKFLHRYRMWHSQRIHNATLLVNALQKTVSAICQPSSTHSEAIRSAKHYLPFGFQFVPACACVTPPPSVILRKCTTDLPTSKSVGRRTDCRHCDRKKMA